MLINMLMASRLLYGMANRGVLPGVFEPVSPAAHAVGGDRCSPRAAVGAAARPVGRPGRPLRHHGAAADRRVPAGQLRGAGSYAATRSSTRTSRPRRGALVLGAVVSAIFLLPMVREAGSTCWRCGSSWAASVLCAINWFFVRGREPSRKSYHPSAAGQPGHLPSGLAGAALPAVPRPAPCRRAASAGRQTHDARLQPIAAAASRVRAASRRPALARHPPTHRAPQARRRLAHRGATRRARTARRRPSTTRAPARNAPRTHRRPQARSHQRPASNAPPTTGPTPPRPPRRRAALAPPAAGPSASPTADRPAACSARHGGRATGRASPGWPARSAWQPQLLPL